YGSFAAIEDVDDRIIAYERRTATERFISITNLSAQPLPFTLPAGEIVLNNYADAETPLKPYQTLLVKE
ncbi:glucohydrolase, partial [Klebsiella michiganensis]